MTLTNPDIALEALRVFEQRAAALGHSVDEILRAMEHDETKEEIAADTQCGVDAKRYRAILLLCEDQSARERVEASPINDMTDEFEEMPTAAQCNMVIDAVITLLEQAEYTI